MVRHLVALILILKYIFNSSLGKIYVVSGDTNNVFKVNEEVCLTIDTEEIKILED